jgi:hypothetical protein
VFSIMATLHSCQKCAGIPFPPHPGQRLLNLLAIYMCSFKKCLFRQVAILNLALIIVTIIFLLRFWSALFILDINPLLDVFCAFILYFLQFCCDLCYFLSTNSMFVLFLLF